MIAPAELARLEEVYRCGQPETMREEIVQNATALLASARKWQMAEPLIKQLLEELRNTPIGIPANMVYAQLAALVKEVDDA